MIEPSLPDDESSRLQSLRRMGLLSTPAEQDFDRVTRTAADHFEMPTVLLSLIDENRQWFKSRQGLDVCETSRRVSFCAHAILADDIFVIPDARTDERFADNPLVTGEPHIVFYAGLPIENAEGFKIGTLCLIDRRPRQFPAKDAERLRDFGRWLQLAVENRGLGESQVALLSELDEARRDSLIDPLTQCWNRRGFADLIARELAKSARDATPVTVAMIDIDHFKRINDTFGHAAGDQALVHLASLLRDQLRPYDVLARLGGEEFAVILSGVGPEDADAATEKLRAAVAAGSLLPDGSHFTISIGFVWRAALAAGQDGAALLDLADKALYRAKQGGRNRVVADSEQG